MATNTLTEFDQELCDYILGQIRPHLRTCLRKPIKLNTLDYDGFHRLDMTQWLGRAMAALPQSLANHIWAGVHGEPVLRSLNGEELNALCIATADPPLRCEAGAMWIPYPELHRRAVQCVPQVQAIWTQQTAEEWTKDSAAFGTRLCQVDLPLSAGIALVRGWLLCIRCLTGAASIASMEYKPSTSEPTGSAVCGWREALLVTGLKKTKLYDLFRLGKLTGYKDGGMIRFYRTGLVSYMKERENVSTTSHAPTLHKKPRTKTPTLSTRFKFL